MNEMIIKKTISRNIALYRKANDLSQVDLASLLETKQSTIATWESGRSMPDVDTLFRICQILGISVNDMYGVSSSADNSLSHDESEIIKAYRAANPLDRALVRRVLGLQEKDAAVVSVS